MKKDFYDKLARPFEADEKKKKRLIRVNHMITDAVYCVYPMLLVVLAVQRDARFLRVLLVPFFTFVAVSVFRKAWNAPRPYEVWDNPPLIPKDTKGNSFPSRHVFSVYIIAMAALYVGKTSGLMSGTVNGVLPEGAPCTLIGVALMVVGVFLAAVRVIARVHFLRDVIAGAVVAIALGYIGFFVI